MYKSRIFKTIVLLFFLLMILNPSVHAVDNSLENNQQKQNSVGDNPVIPDEWQEASDYYSVKMNKTLILGNKRIISVGDKGTIRILNNNSWTNISSSSDRNLNELINFKGNELLAFGDKGTILYSNGADTWKKIISGTDNNITAAASNKDNLVAFTQTGNKVLYSKDGQSYKIIDIKNQKPINRLIWTGNAYIGVGDGGTFCISRDGQNWQCSIISDSNLYDAAWNGKTLAVFGNNTICTSCDFVKWDNKILSKNKAASYEIKKGIWNGLIFTAFGVAADGQKSAFAFYSSSDGITWNMTLADLYEKGNGYHEANDLIWDGKSFKAVGVGFYMNNTYSCLLYSDDGVKWRSFCQLIENKSKSFSAILSLDKKYLATDFLGTAYYSNDGIDWKSVGNMPRFDYWGLSQIIYNGSNFIIPTAHYLYPYYSSSDGVNWSKSTGKTIGVNQGNDILKFNGKTYLTFDYASIITSTDLKKWEVTKINNNGNNISDIAISDKDTGVAIGNKTMYYSSDLKVWKKLPCYNLYKKIIWNGNIFIASGVSHSKNILSTSKDGLKWSDIILDIPYEIRSMACGNNSTVLIDFSGVIYSSRDNKNWTKSQPVSNNILNSVRFINNEFYCLSNIGVILHSKDGLNWVQDKSPVNTVLCDIASDGKIAIIVGYYNTFLVKKLK